METDPNCYLLPHTSSYPREQIPASLPSSTVASLAQSSSSSFSKSSVQKKKHSSKVQTITTASSSSSKKGPEIPIDSAYSTEHEKSPDQEKEAKRKPQPAKKFTAKLQDDDMWKVFYKLGNEMIVTKPGR